MELKMVTQEELVEVLKDVDGRFFSLAFFRRRDRQDSSQMAGDLRLFTSVRRRVTKHLRGGGPSYNANDHRLLRVYRMQDADDDYGTPGYRSVPFEGLLAVRLNGTVYITLEGWARLLTPSSTPDLWLERSRAAFDYIGRLLGETNSPVRLESADA